MDIAIIGAAVKLPQANNIDEFWNNLKNKKHCISEVNKSRWDAEKYYTSDISKLGKTYSKWAGFIEDIDSFDSLYFKIKEDEFHFIDHTQRLALEITANLLETSGYGGDNLWGKNVGVFIGAPNNPYYYSKKNIESKSINGMQSSNAMIANRISYFFNLKGTSKTIDTICSSSLVSIHLACKSIENKESEIAIAGGLNLLTSVEHFILLSQMHILSPEHKCKTFDKDADGFVLGEGIGIFLLKSLDKAIEDRDVIWAVIKASKVNHNGYTENSMLPDAYSISNLLNSCWESSNIDPETITFIEVNGSGTSLGDAIEVQGLQKAFKTTKKHFCALGSVKTNVGNLEAASGACALAKVILSMKYNQIPANLHFNSLNPLIKLANSPFFLPDKLIEWKAESGILRAGINGLGVGGTNAHLIIQSPPKLNKKNTLESIKTSQNENLNIICISAKTRNSFFKLINIYINSLESIKEEELLNFCFTINTGRTHFNHRALVIFESKEDLINKLYTLLENKESDYIFHSLNKPINTQKKLENKNFLKNFLKNYKGNQENLFYKDSTKIYYIFFAKEDLSKISFLSNFGIIAQQNIILTSESELIDNINKFSKQKYAIFILFQCSEFISKIESTTKNAKLLEFPNEIENNYKLLLNLLAELYCNGAFIDFKLFYKKNNYYKFILPIYPYEKKEYKEKVKNFIPIEKKTNEDLKKLTFPELKSKIEDIITKTLSNILEKPINEIYIHKDFIEYMLDSVCILKLIYYLKQEIGVSLSPLEFSKYKTISDLALNIANIISHNKFDLDYIKDYEDKVTLELATQKHFNVVKNWLSNKNINQWLDNFFENEFSIMEYGFFLRKKDKKTFIINFDNKPVGIGGFVNIDKSNFSAESWIVIGEISARCRGISVIAGIELCKKAFLELEIKTLISKVRKDNEPSLAMLEYSNWRKVGLLKNWLKKEKDFYDCYIFQLTGNDFLMWLNERNKLRVIKMYNMILEDIQNKIKDYLEKEFSIDDENFDIDSDLFEDGYIESIHLEKFFTYIEKEFNILIEEDLFFDERISSIKGISNIILEIRKKKTQ